MPSINLAIELDTKTLPIMRVIDGEKTKINKDDLINFITGKLGDIYLNIHAPHDGVMMELHAKKSSMKKKEAIFDIMPTGKGDLLIKVKGTFKVDAYSHVAERIKASPDTIFVTGIFAGEWPPTGAHFVDYDAKSQTSKITAKLV